MKLKIIRDIKKPNFMGCGAYEYCVENNSFYLAIPKDAIVNTTKKSWENEYDDITTIYNGKKCRVNKEDCVVELI